MRQFLLIKLLILGVSIFAQTDDPNDIAYYLNDGKKNDANANIQWAASSLVEGYLDFHFEQKINDHLSFQVGGGPQVSKGIHIMDWISDGLYPFWEDSELSKGLGYSIAGKYYVSGTAITDMGYVGMVFRSRRSVYETDVLGYEGEWVRSWRELYANSGVRYIFAETVSADISSGIGVQFQGLSYPEADYLNELRLRFLYTIELKLGYYLKYK